MGFPGMPNMGSPGNDTWPMLKVAEVILSAGAPQFPTITFNPMSGLLLFLNVTGYGGTDVVSLRFNGDSGTNYWDRNITLPVGTTVFVDTITTATTLIRCGLPINKGRAVMAQIVNSATKNKVVQINNQFGSGANGTAATVTLAAAGEWLNTTTAINQIDVVTAGGLNIGAGSSLVLLGYNRAI